MNSLKNTFRTDYTVISNKLVNCFELHPMTRFLYIYLAAQSNAFQFTNTTLCKALDCSEATLRKYMKQAIGAGLISRKQRLNGGKFGFFVYTLHDPTALQILPHGKKTGAEKNRGGKNVTLNKEELSNKEEIINKEEAAATRDAQKITPECVAEFDEQTAERDNTPPGCAAPPQADDKITPATAERAQAMIRTLREQAAPIDEPRPIIVPASQAPSDTDLIDQEVEYYTNDPGGKVAWDLIRRGAGAQPGELTNPEPTVLSAVLKLGEGVKANRGQLRRKYLGFARTQLKIDRQQKNQPHGSQDRTGYRSAQARTGNPAQLTNEELAAKAAAYYSRRMSSPDEYGRTWGQ